MDMHSTQEAPEADDTSSHGANGPSLDHIRDSIRSHLRAATGSGMDTLRSFRDIGVNLAEAKEISSGTKGAFGAWCDANFQFSKEWRARLLKLAARWDDFTSARVWAETQGRILGRKEYSVDGALGLIAEWQKATKPQPVGADGEDGEAGEGGTKERKKSAADLLREQLAEALERIRRLEEELAAATGGTSRKAKDKPRQDGPASGSKGPTVDAATKARARKVWGLYTRGATDGEKGAAKARLEELAAKFNATFEEFCRACGLKEEAAA